MNISITGGGLLCPKMLQLPLYFSVLKANYAPVAQWIRASVFGTEGRTFESYRVYHLQFGSVAQLVRASAS